MKIVGQDIAVQMPQTPALPLDAAALAPPPLRIGEWRVDRMTNALSRNGETVRIEPKAMETLIVLAQRAGRVVSRAELLAAIWPGVVVGDEALTQCIIKLRRALGDHPRAPAYIETIAKRGYRLIAPVTTDAMPAGDRGAEDGASAGNRIPPRVVAGIVGLGLLACSVFLYSFLHTPAIVPPVAEPPDAVSARNPGVVTVTVLPFEAVGEGAKESYLAQGISNDLMTDLSRLSGLRLIAPRMGASSASRAGGPRYIVSGSVQHEGEALRINVRLTDARTHDHIWSQRFERPFGDLFAIQDEIGRNVTAQLPAKISDTERRRLAKRYTTSLEAYDYFLRGQALFLVRRADENAQARAYYAKAIEADPGFARAYAGLAMTYAIAHRYEHSTPPSSGLARALELAQTARAIDPDLPDVYWALAFVYTQSRRHDEALTSLQKAIALNRSYADAYALMGGIYTYIGQPAKTLPLLRTALRLDPDGGYLYYLLLGRAYLFLDDSEQALINLREAHARNPDDIESGLYLAAALAASGDVSAAEWQAEEIKARDPGLSTRSWLNAYPMTSVPQQQKLAALLEKAGL